MRKATFIVNSSYITIYEYRLSNSYYCLNSKFNVLLLVVQIDKKSINLFRWF